MPAGAQCWHGRQEDTHDLQRKIYHVNEGELLSTIRDTYAWLLEDTILNVRIEKFEG